MRHILGTNTGILTVFFLLLSGLCLGQTPFTNGEFETTPVSRPDTNRLTLLYFHTSWCGPCRQMEQTTFRDAELNAFISKNFYAYQLDADSPDGKRLGEKYAVYGYPTFALLDANGQLVYKAVGYSTSERFRQRMQYGIAEANSPTNLVRVEAQYQQNPNDMALVKVLVEKRRYADLDNSALLDTLLTRLPADSLATPSVLKLLMFCFTGSSEQSTIRSKGFALLKNQEALAIANQGHPIGYGQALFNRADKSMMIAEETNDLPLFEEATNQYLELNPHSTAVEGLKREKYIRQMRFYKQMGLRDKMVKASVSYCEDSLMRLGEEGILRLAAQYVSRGVVMDESLPYDQKIAACRQNIENEIASDLNQGAWGFYEKVTDKALLNQAIGWSRQSLALVEGSNYLDTLAHLLYKTGQYEEAVAYETRAIKLAERRQESVSEYQEALEQFKTRKLK